MLVSPLIRLKTKAALRLVVQRWTSSWLRSPTAVSILCLPSYLSYGWTWKSGEQCTHLNSSKLNIKFICADVRNYQNDYTYDLVVSLFHAASYQINNTEVSDYFRSAARCTSDGGLFVFDFWYRPAVWVQRLAIRIKRVSNEGISITRIAEPSIVTELVVVDVDYEVLIDLGDGSSLWSISERHTMRYDTLPEINLG
jgi:SAM-dependent methyltransferase